MLGRICIIMGLQEGITGHTAPGRDIPCGGWIISGYEQRLTRSKFLHGEHELHHELTATFFAQINRLIRFRRKMFHSSSLSQKITITLFTFLLSK